MPGNSSTVGIIANPVSARDIRRLVANANSLQITDRANIVLRVLGALGAVGVDHVLMMPDRMGVCAHLRRNLNRNRAASSTQPMPELRYIDMAIESTVDDTLRAVDAMVAEGVAAIVVLGGDGTHRAVASRCGKIPIGGLSTGTNNAFPETREPTVTGLAVGLYATARVPFEVACRPNKMLMVDINEGQRRDCALVDVAITSERYIGARALYKPHTFRELFVTFAEPEVIGMSAIAGFLQPVARWDRRGLHVQLGNPDTADSVLQVPIAPGLFSRVGIRDYQLLPPGQVTPLESGHGCVALDGEREIEFSPQDHVTVCLHTDAFYTVDVGRTLHHAAEGQLLLSTSGA